jgi:hypothetical protein
LLRFSKKSAVGLFARACYLVRMKVDARKIDRIATRRRTSEAGLMNKSNTAATDQLCIEAP